MTGRTPALEPFDALVGTWSTEATHPLLDAVVPGSVTFEWLEGGQFLVQRSRHEHELFPDHPTFAQRFSATVGSEAFEGLWQVAETPGEWRDDLRLWYRRGSAR